MGASEPRLLFRMSERMVMSLIIASTVLALVLDITSPVGFPLNFFYLLPIAISLLSSKPRLHYCVALIATVLSVVAVPVKLPGDLIYPLINRPLSIASFWLTAWIIDYTKDQAVQLNRQIEENRIIMDVVPAAIWISHDPEARVITGNKMAASFYESSEEENVSAGPISGKEWNEARRLYRDGRELKPTELPMQVSAAQGIEVNNSEVEVLLPSGRKLVMLGNSRPLFDQEGRVRGSVASFIDITERKRAEQELRDRAEELARSNAELQQFAYVASHDLQEPLRTILNYLGLLSKKYGEELNPQAKEYMSIAMGGAEQMRQLVNDLLQYSRIDSIPSKRAWVDMNKVARTIENNLHVAIHESRGELILHPLPTLLADEQQMIQLFQNLISNALKFRGRSTPKVEVSAHILEKEHVISIKDNGIGIDPKYRDNLFKMFQRLHTRDEYPGTGIGLAISKKIVEQHGGRIWFESEPGKGTTFFFSLPESGRPLDYRPELGTI